MNGMLEIIQALRFLQILNYYRVKFEFEEIFFVLCNCKVRFDSRDVLFNSELEVHLA